MAEHGASDIITDGAQEQDGSRVQDLPGAVTESFGYAFDAVP
jgi:hypothetical protein